VVGKAFGAVLVDDKDVCAFVAWNHEKDPVDCNTVLSDRSTTSADLTPALVERRARVSEKLEEV
jgi:hypothetical protein